jgi:RNA-directed DNA polymerase
MPQRGQDGARSPCRPPNGPGQPSPAGSRPGRTPHGGGRAPEHRPHGRGVGTDTRRKRGLQPAAHVTSGAVGDWQAIDGKHVYRTVQHLRPRLLRASREGVRQHLRSRQRLRRKRRAHARARGRRVTPGPHGQSPSGSEHGVVTTAAARGTRGRPLSALERPRVHPVRRVDIPKRQGTRPLGLPPRVERWVHALGKNALEPCGAARFDGSSSGFRPGRGGHDALETVFRLARPHTTRPWVLAADLDGAFHPSGPTALMQALGHVPARELSQPWRNAGYVADERRPPTAAGGPQGGVLSPRWWHVALPGHGARPRDC